MSSTPSQISTSISHAGRGLLDRRRFLAQTATGLAGIALAHLLRGEGAHGASSLRPSIDPAHPLAARRPPLEAKAKNVLVIFCSGACSQLDTWDYKPELIRRHDQPMPGGDKLVTFQGANGNLVKSPYTFRPRGESGKMTSDLLPRLGALADEMCFVHSLTSLTNTHGPGENFLSTGFTLDGFPSMGAWVSYALGTANGDLPAFVAIPDPRGVPQSSVNNWGPGFLPAVFQGTPFNSSQPIRHLERPRDVSPTADAATSDLLRLLNDRHLARFPGDTELSARIASYEMAAKMQLSVPRITNLATESRSTLALYGVDDSQNPLKAAFARNCILARRLIESGVRFVQLFNGAYAMGEGVGNWDGHRFLKKQYDVHGPVLDQPAAALLTDLKQRGLLADTLVVWCTEFGRMPTFQKGASGRDHNPQGFTAWLAGAGVKRAFSYGATDEFGHRAVENVLSIHDLHATILWLLGLDHTRLTFYHNGLERRLTDVHGRVITEILAS
jgi:Protein of unknown function (DUF1501)